MTEPERLLHELRPVSFAVAYRMLGSVSEAEDVVQEALLRLHRALEAGEQIASPRAFLATVTTRLAINERRSARARREHYVGDWLPEPIITDGDDDPRSPADRSCERALRQEPRPRLRADEPAAHPSEPTYCWRPRGKQRVLEVCATA